jgi:transcriptional regulator with XRE-family HTH domain
MSRISEKTNRNPSSRVSWEGIAYRLKEIRGKTSQVELGGALGVPQNVVSRYERGRVKPPLDYLLAASRYANVTLDWLITGEKPKHRKRDA